MKLYDVSLVIIIVVVSVACVVGLISTRYLGPDNPIEEAAEAVIKEETGINVELSSQPKVQNASH